MFGTILQRMIFGELLRVFFLALITLTGLFMLGGIVAEATQRGLAPSQILMVIPLLIPNTLPYTVPATCLFATCVVYGRLAADNEITAIKSAGVHLGRLVGPALLLGLLMSAAMGGLYYSFIPSTHQMLRSQVLGDFEELLYGMLKKQGCLRHPKVRFSMWVRQVQGKRLIDAIFKERDDKGGYKFVARAREARIHFNPASNNVRVDMSYVSTYGENDLFAGNLSDPSYEVPIPQGFLGNDYQRRASDLTWQELLVRREQMNEEVRISEEQAANPPIDPKMPPHLVPEAIKAFKNLPRVKQRERNTVDVELHMRPAIATGCLCFVLIGAPVGMWFSKADFLSAFVSCFLPTVFIYYPLLLCGTNLAKDGKVPAALGLWGANAIMGVAALLVFSRLVRR